MKRDLDDRFKKRAIDKRLKKTGNVSQYNIMNNTDIMEEDTKQKKTELKKGMVFTSKKKDLDKDKEKTEDDAWYILDKYPNYFCDSY